MKCFRCGADLGHADDRNADYILAADTVVRENVERLYAILEKHPEEPVSSYEEAELVHGKNLVRCEVRRELADVQKTGLVCPDCYKPTDLIIWGVHKK